MTIDSEVASLLSLKAQYKELTGEDLAGGARSSKGGKNSKGTNSGAPSKGSGEGKKKQSQKKDKGSKVKRSEVKHPIGDEEYDGPRHKTRSVP